MNDLEKYFYKNTGRQISKWKHYFEIYDRHFSQYRGTDVHVLEFGVSQGGSLQMWKEYFGPNCKIYGVDINPHCMTFEDDQIKIFIGDQEDRQFLHSVAEEIPRIDILIDDGGHTMKQLICTYEEMFKYIDKDGIYLAEDLHTCYWPYWSGGYKKRGTFLEYSKNFIDSINAWHSRSFRLKVSDFTRTVYSLHFYDSILVIEKRERDQPSEFQSGISTIPEYVPIENFRMKLNRKLRIIKNIFTKKEDS